MKTTRLDVADIQEGLRAYRESIPYLMEHAAVTAQLTRARYNAYLKEGFTEAQAIELCKSPLITG